MCWRRWWKWTARCLTSWHPHIKQKGKGLSQRPYLCIIAYVYDKELRPGLDANGEFPGEDAAWIHDEWDPQQLKSFWRFRYVRGGFAFTLTNLDIQEQSGCFLDFAAYSSCFHSFLFKRLKWCHTQLRMLELPFVIQSSIKVSNCFPQTRETP